ncbi:adenylate cyclase associated N terminal-domain-containing protein [Cantharellus anzutake]|uniref:adenylate cyclase associated N terminal-domain-containing protein n=1 Tax=Cantharellus anzutake TaxID=1750568 RepID=UPI001909031A|nr:adenylate cyclase associated N terminal-domain-containing protein [Cantharellus anzutake]KAF8325999.1 adenylate cyclase associated N terminal-domain-containing protein [Cantharellus anzutake]
MSIVNCATGLNIKLNTLTTIIKRLEAATSRLEDLAASQSLNAQTHTQTSVLQAPHAAPAAPSAPPPPSAPVIVEDPPIITAFDETVVVKLAPFLQLSGELSPVLKDQVSHVARLFELQRGLILQAAQCKKPADAAFGVLLEPFSKEIALVGEIKDSNRSNREFFNHLSTIADGIPAVGWVTVSPKPAPYVTEMKNAAQFYANRVIKEFKDKDKKHVEWVKSFDALLDTLQSYVKEHHTTGLAWNPKGQDIASYNAPATKPTGAPSPPPPPPPPPPPLPPAISVPPGSGPTTGANGATAVFAQINQGSDITKGLRKVPKEEMTHKNPSLRVGSVVPSGSSPTRATSPGPPGKKPARPAKPVALAGKKPSKFALEANKWVVEFFEDNRNLAIENTSINQVVSIYGCKNSTIQVKGKVNAVTLVQCKKTSVLVDSVVSGISITSSPSFAIQITGKAPTIQLDTTDSGQIYLSRECLDVEITSAKCSAINVSLPVEGEDDGVFVERAVPEMLKTIIKGGQLVTNVVEHSG